ncbi:ATP-dependent DNA helicase DDX11 [Chelonus insularis]|uniref:ATP-dependent DNA helicase DDX11 n=1 Tax=Chelonus insularis TaxID=460826 RepID=UPI00158B54A8|nr:ATP-dependent DNA helicase DDX11 [Chelonus insularis]
MKPPEEFPFPFPPYDIQKNFMKNLYSCLDNGSLGIFESPTGTGKSLSIICGAFKWLVDYEKHYKDSLEVQLKDFDNKLEEIKKEFKQDWFAEQTAEIKINSEKQVVQKKLDILKHREERKNKFKERLELENISKKKRFWKSKSVGEKQNDKKNKDEVSKDGLEDSIAERNDIDLLLEDFSLDSDSDDEETKEEEEAEVVKIFFCSRTHSQLTQFIGEVKRSPYVAEISLVPLASRQNYCINKAVKSLNHINLINDKCIQMQKKKTSSKEEKDLKRSKVATACPFNPGNQSLLVADIVTNVQDVEDIAVNAKNLNTCAYYASRKTLPDIQVILVPYNLVLHKSTRISSGINLKNNILIIDEAHNLLEAIENIHNAIITGRNILHCYSQITQYHKRFENLLSAKSVLYLSRLSFILKKFIQLLGGTTKSHHEDKIEKPKSEIYTISEFETVTDIYMINMFELTRFVNESKLMHKLRGYVEKYSGDLKVRPVVKKTGGVSAFLSSLQKKDDVVTENKQEENVPTEEIPSTPIMLINNFLQCLRGESKDGRIFVNQGSTIGQGTIKFMLLNPASRFHDIIQDARSVILAGGTMEPISEFKNQLFIGAGANPQRIVTYSCDHVVPKENILTRIVTQGPTKVTFEFNYNNRGNPELINELGRTLVRLCNIVPGGIVVFFSSYNYEATLYKGLENSDVIKEIQKKKKIFREPKLASDVNLVLQNYAKAIENPQSPQNGALLFSVVGGKLSEGLNFSDDLGRCVVVVGMPYPNTKSLELQEKMKYLNENVKQGAGNEYYENTCMKAVNQCIGRAVRHIADYSTVVLLDKRYSTKTKALPGWIQRSLETSNDFTAVVNDIDKFFINKKKKT